MSRNERLLRVALERRGYTARDVHYEPIHGPCFEMAGCAGGWYVDGEPVGYNVEQALDFVNRFWRKDGPE
jgi:hypothetical protein